MSRAKELIKVVEAEEIGLNKIPKGNTTWRVWTYDVWGNAEDGYEVNDRNDQGEVELSDEPTDQQILDALIDMGILKSGTQLSDLEIGGDDVSITVDAAEDDFPLAGLVKKGD